MPGTSDNIASDQSNDDHGTVIDQESPRLAANSHPGCSNLTVPHTPTSRLRPRSKRVRFSDPGPQLEQEDSDNQDEFSTGLTPFVSRTTLGPSSSAEPASRKFGEGRKRLGRSRRRHTTPNFNTRLSQLREEQTLHPGEETTFQYLPFHDIIDLRSKRRMGRSGFSQEMNEIEKARKDQKRIKRENEGELTRLKEELDLLRCAIARTREPDQRENAYQEPIICTMPDKMNSKNPNTEPENTPSLASATNNDDCMQMQDFDMMDEDDYPTDNYPLTPETPSHPPRSTDVCTQASIADPAAQCQIETLNQELERKDSEQRQLFEEWQRLLPESPEAATNFSSPPADLTTKLITTMQAITARASEVTESMNGLHDELSGHGFAGESASEVVANIDSRFRQARIELERAVPGETADVSFTNWRDIIDALVTHIYHLVQNVTEAQNQVVGCESRESALRHQFDATLVRMEQASKKNQGLERYSESIAEDMLNMRMTLQSLEKDLESQEKDKTRLHGALNKYRDDLSMCEKLNSKLEDELEESSRKSERLGKLNSRLKEESKLGAEKIYNLENNLVTEQKLVQTLQSSLDQRNQEISNVRMKIQQLETEKYKVTATLEITKEESQHHEKEIGFLIADLSSIANSLDEAKAENEALQSDKDSLEDHLKDMQRIFSPEAFQQAQEKANETAKALADWQRGVELLDKRITPKKNIDNNSSTFHSFSTIGSEPMTPASVDRFKNVEFGRGNKRKRCPDEVLAEDEE